MKHWNAVVCAIAVAIGGVGLSACTAIERDNALQTERTLAAAGFQMKFADDSGKIQNTSALPQRELTPTRLDGETRFVYADAEFCKCVYVGTEKAYQRYQNLAVRQKIAQANLSAAQAQESAAMNWGMWGGWGPWW